MKLKHLFRWKNPQTSLDESASADIDVNIADKKVSVNVAGVSDWEYLLLHPWVKWQWPWKALGLPGKALERFSYFMSGEWRQP